jgi:hypothetical protein
MAKPPLTINIHLKNEGQKSKNMKDRKVKKCPVYGRVPMGRGNINRKEAEYCGCTLYTCMKPVKLF